MNLKRISDFMNRASSACAAAVLASAMMMSSNAIYAQSAPGGLPPDLQEIVKFTQAHMTDDVIIAYIKNSGKSYYLNGDALLALNGVGVSQPVLSALIAAAPPPGAAPAQVPPPNVAPAQSTVITAPPETPTIDYFQGHLTPYGQWIDVPGIGAAWVPAEANVPGWRPYMDAGHWQFTDAGWFWQSDYPWGDMAFHYGRWVNNEFTGGRWAWVPGYYWAPSWVSWREGAGGLGWAPLPWDVEFRVGLGLYWHGAAVVGGVDFGLGFGAFVFVGTDHFWGGNYRVYAFDERRSRDFFVHSEFHAGYRVEGGHLMAEGLGRDHMKEITHHEVVVAKASEMRQKEEHQNFAKRTEQHHELARVTVHKPEAARQEASRTAATRERTTGSTPERTSATTGRPGTETAASPGTAGHPAAATSSTRTSTGYPGATTGRPGTSAYSPGGASSAAGHSKTNSTSSKSSAPSTQKKPE
jgi:hypothetical protein